MFVESVFNACGPCRGVALARVVYISVLCGRVVAKSEAYVKMYQSGVSQWLFLQWHVLCHATMLPRMQSGVPHLPHQLVCFSTTLPVFCYLCHTCFSVSPCCDPDMPRVVFACMVWSAAPSSSECCSPVLKTCWRLGC